MRTISIEEIIKDLETDFEIMKETAAESALRTMSQTISDLRTNTDYSGALRFYAHLTNAAKNAGLNSEAQKADLAWYTQIHTFLKSLQGAKKPKKKTA